MNEPNPVAGVPTQDERTWGMLAHLTAFSGFLVPLGNVIAPLVVWLVKRDQSEFVADQGKEALNFNISVLLAGVVCGILVWIFIGILLGVALFILLAGHDDRRRNQGIRRHSLSVPVHATPDKIFTAR